VGAIQPPVTSFAGLLRQLRTEARLTQEELAETAGLSPRSVSDLERGINRTARKETAQLLADALGLAGATRALFVVLARGRGGDEDSRVPPAAEIKAGGVAVATRALPRDIASFTGRERELRQLVGVMAGAPGSGGVVGIHAIGGMAGIGKTTLAVHAAHRLAPYFPDGQIFLPLHGHTPGQQPLDPADALASLLLTGGVPAAQIPPGLGARTALWRDWLAGKQLLLVLDDAVDSEQVRPLLPGTAGSLVLVTSRRYLAALEDAQAVSLDTLPAGEAAELLVRLAARPGLEPDEAAVSQIIRLCGCLPLAVGMLARKLHHHPAWTAAELAADLAAARDRLELMQAENLSVAAAFDLSYRDLTAAQQRLFRRLGLHAGADIDAYAVAALDGTDLATARRHLEALYDQYLIDEPSRGRYRLHDLIREHARVLAGTDQPSERDAAAGRLQDYYLHIATITEAHLARHSRTRPGPAAPTAFPAVVPDIPDPKYALAWARTEHANLLACLDQAASTGQHARVVALTADMAHLLRQEGPSAEAITRLTAAIQAARHTGDRLGEANTLLELGTVRQMTGDYPGATRAQEEALGIYLDLGDRVGEANARSELGIMRSLTGDNQGAIRGLEEALGIYLDVGDRLGEANALRSLGDVRLTTCDYRGATQATEQALDICRDLGDRLGEAYTLLNLGYQRRMMGEYVAAAQAVDAALRISVDLDDRRSQSHALHVRGMVCYLTGDYPGAAQALQESLDISVDLGERPGVAQVLASLGAVLRLTGDYPGAAQALQEALVIYLDVGDRDGEAETLNEMGALHRVQGSLAEAEDCHRQALALARNLGLAWNEAHALAGLGRCARAAGRAADAEARLRQAQDIFQRTGAGEAPGVAGELDTLIRAEAAAEGSGPAAAR
jgi:tetratricopeptide (TPR) repeat protein/transcriptional regulator with XRE-family HTH domain